MKSTTALWFDIEAAFAEFDRLYIEALAAELSASKHEEQRLPRGSTIDGARDDSRDDAPSEDWRLAKALELAKDPEFREAHRAGADLVELRAHIRKRLTWLRSRLADVLPEYEVYHALFPIVVYCDELVNGVTKGKPSRWEPLQSELYDIDNGGELFYSILEERLRQAETHPIVFEVFYFCLNDGFVGMYQGAPKKIEEYLGRLRDRIPCKPIAVTETTRERGRIELVEFPWQYYAVAGAVIVAGYVLLRVMAPSA